MFPPVIQLTLTTNTRIKNENSNSNHFASNKPYLHFPRKINYYRSCCLLSHGSTTNNLEIANGNKQIVQTSKHLRPRKSIAHLLTTQKESFTNTVYQKPFVSERYSVALPFITS